MKQVRGYITRQTMLYKTGVEYGDYTMNHVLGCAHGCKFPCYAYLQKKRFGQIKDYNEWIQPYLVSNTLELLDKEIPRLKDKISSVQLCFSTDPFMYGYDEIKKMSIASIKKLNEADIKCTVLTKGILPMELSKLKKINEYGITLVSLDKEFRSKMEPGTAPYSKRITSLEKMHEKGYKTWVSIEPYPTPNIVNQKLEDVLKEIEFVDKIIFGRTNYSKEVSSYLNYKEFYNECASQIIDFCKKNKKDYHIKHGTITK